MSSTNSHTSVSSAWTGAGLSEDSLARSGIVRFSATLSVFGWKGSVRGALTTVDVLVLCFHFWIELFLDFTDGVNRDFYLWYFLQYLCLGTVTSLFPQVFFILICFLFVFLMLPYTCLFGVSVCKIKSSTLFNVSINGSTEIII